MTRISAGILMFRRAPDGRVEVLLVHPGGPYFRRKDLGAWSIPKGEVKPGKDLLAAAQREFQEETAIRLTGPWIKLGFVVQKGGKKVHAWACEGDGSPHEIVSESFQMEWPPRCGRMATFPEIDRAEFFEFETARRKCLPAQVAFIDRLEAFLAGNVS